MEEKIIKKTHKKASGIFLLLLLISILIIFSAIIIFMVYIDSDKKDNDTLTVSIVFGIIGILIFSGLYIAYKFFDKFRLYKFTLDELKHLYKLSINEDYISKLNALEEFMTEDYKFERSKNKVLSRIISIISLVISLAFTIVGFVLNQETMYTICLLLFITTIGYIEYYKVFKKKPTDLKLFISNEKYQIISSDFLIIAQHYTEKKREEENKNFNKKQKNKIKKSSPILFWLVQVFLLIIAYISIYSAVVYVGIYYKIIYISFAIISLFLIIRNIYIKYHKSIINNDKTQHEKIYDSLYNIKKHEKRISKSLKNQLSVYILYDLLINNSDIENTDLNK